MQKSELQVSLFEMQSGSCPWTLWDFSIGFGPLDLKIFLIVGLCFCSGWLWAVKDKIHTWSSDLETTKASVGSF